MSRTMMMCVWLLIAGCATVEQLRTRAAFDLQCPESQVRTYYIDHRTTGVTGCGKRATYITTCSDPDNAFTCTWALNAAVREEPASRPATYRPAAAVPRSAPTPTDRRIVAAQNEGSQRLELEVAGEKKRLRYSTLGASRAIKNCRELGLATGAGRVALPARYEARVRGGSILEVVESELSEGAFTTLETATALDACGQTLTFSAGFLAAVRPQRAAPPLVVAPAAPTNPTLRLAMPYVTLVLESDPKEPAAMVALGFVTTVKAAAGEPCAIKLLRDAEPVELGALEHRAAEAAHEYRAEVALTALDQLAAAKRVIGKICEQRFQLGDAHLAQLRDYLLRLLLRLREERQLAN
jgi:hypothetical protein